MTVACNMSARPKEFIPSNSSGVTKPVTKLIAHTQLRKQFFVCKSGHNFCFLASCLFGSGCLSLDPFIPVIC